MAFFLVNSYLLHWEHTSYNPKSIKKMRLGVEAESLLKIQEGHMTNKKSFPCGGLAAVRLFYAHYNMIIIY